MTRSGRDGRWRRDVHPTVRPRPRRGRHLLVRAVRTELRRLRGHIALVRESVGNVGSNGRRAERRASAGPSLVIDVFSASGECIAEYRWAATPTPAAAYADTSVR
ncbi:hypothetical protein C9J85_01720 [Haloferax sp. wsp5]|nr:hypothetical protein C9J85_01720 [Haloferax sp. wsp5]